MEKIQFAHNNYQFTVSYNAETNSVENVYCKNDFGEYNSGTIWNIPIKIKSANQLHKLFQNYIPTIQFSGDKMNLDWYVDILDYTISITLFCEDVNAEEHAANVAEHTANVEEHITEKKLDPNEVDWIAIELENLSLNAERLAKNQVVASIDPIFTEDPRDEHIANLNATIKHKNEEIAQLSDDAKEYAKYIGIYTKELQTMDKLLAKYKDKLAKKDTAIARYKEQITYQCGKIYKLKRDLDRTLDPYMWK